MASTLAPVALETKSSASRITKEGRRLTYVLEVVQKPERARACGQGAKSSSDRRPVDPPPIVDLRIYEGDERDGNDITFSYNANFFLFATLENARPMAHGRVLQEHINQPVLTGTPVAGMAYLDRPKQAGYFIFPDLSVRHEGRYRLAFTLFEETKDPKDADQLDTNTGPVHGQVNCRCEVKSVPFNVYSAKKFPGLTESTLLSRVVADQGCRVRIRRDVRMRKRPEQGSKEWDDYEDSTADQRAARSVSPDAHKPAISAPSPAGAIDRSRSASNASNASYHPANDLSRRSSHHDLPQQYQTGFLPHPADSSSSSSHGQPAQPNAPPILAAPGLRPPPAPTPAPSQHASQPPTPTSYNPSGSYEPAHMAPFAQGYNGPSYAPPPPMQAHHQPPPYAFPQGASSTASNSSSGYGYMQSPGVYDHASARPEHLDYASQHRMSEDSAYSRLPVPHVPSSMLHAAKGLPPLQHVDSIAAKAEVMSPMTMTGVEAPARPPPAQYVSSVRNATQTKRSFSSTFNTQHIQEPLRAGARPNTMANSLPTEASDGSDEDLDFEAFKMSYRRADGSRVQRTWPKKSV